MKVTFDSNVLVYSVDRQAGDRHLEAKDLIRRATASDCVLTLQCLGEFFHVTTRKGKLAPEDAEACVADWRAVFPVHAASDQTLVRAIALARRHRFSFWDAMLWATAEEAGCHVLLSEDFQDGRKVGSLRSVNPFASRNAALIETVLPG